MEKIKLVVSDLDGTLLPYGDDRLSEDIIQSIKKLLESDMDFAISSGRTYNELVSLLPEFSDRIYFTCCDGALTVKNGKPVYERKIETADIELFFKQRFQNFSFVLHGAFTNYSFGNIPSEASLFNCIPIRSIYDIKEKVFKITTYGERLELPEYCGIRTHWDGGNNNVAQYVNRYCNKGTALSDLQMRLMLTKYDTAVLGDRGNDISMIKGAKISCCIGNRCSELSESCLYRFDSGTQALDSIISDLM